MGICLIHMIFVPNKTATTQQWQVFINMIAIMKILMWRRSGDRQLTTI